MVELRKRKAPAEPAPPPPAKKKTSATKAAVDKVKNSVSKKAAPVSNGASAPSKVAVGDTIPLEKFGGEIETNDGDKTTLKKLVDDSKAGVVIFTYPKASTPGCTQQACLFRDSYEPLTATGYSIYGLSSDSTKANTTFKTKQKLPYSLLCDPAATLIAAVGLKKSPKGTTRGVFVVDKSGKVLAAEPGSPKGTLEVVQKLVDGEGKGVAAAAAAVEETNGQEKETNEDTAVEPEAPTQEEEKNENEAKADVAADVADTAAKLDGEAK